MGFNQFTLQTMVRLSASWLDPRRSRPILELFPRGRGLLVHIASAHQGILDVQSLGSELDTQIADLVRECLTLNTTFNVLARSIHQVLGGAAGLLDDVALVARCEAARDAVVPQGAAVAKWSYADKAGEVELVATRRTPEVDETLKCVILPDGSTLAESVDRWVAVGRELGEKDSLRHALERRRESTPGLTVTPGDVQSARRQWARVARALLDDIALEKLDAESAARLSGDLLRALEQSNAKRAVTDEDTTSDEETEGDETAPETPVKTDAAPVVVNPREAPANDAAPVPARKVG